MTKKVFKNKTDEPTKSIPEFKLNNQEKLKYNKMSVEEQLEYDLKKEEGNNKNLKTVVRNKGYKFKKINSIIMDVVGKYNPKITHIKNLVIAGKDLISIRINEDKFEKQTFTLKQIKSLSNTISEKLKEEEVNGKMMTSLLYGELGWKSGYLRDFGIETKLYDPNQLYTLNVAYEPPKHIQSFNMYIALGNKDIGGEDDYNNDCLYNSLKYYIFNIEKYFKSPSDFKQFLGLKRDEKVPLKLLDKIELKLKTFQINVRGDFIRSSTVKSEKIINLLLINEHFTVEKLDKHLTPNIKYSEKQPIMYDKKTYEAFDGVKKWVISKTDRNDILYNPKSQYIIINRENQGFDDEGNKINITIEEEYKQFLLIADTLKTESKGLINLYKSGSYHDASLNLFDRLTKFINPEPILQDEAEFIKLSSFSALIYSEKYQGELFQYDVKSLYPYIMTSTTLKFPIKRGEFRFYKTFGDFIEYGIYRCKVEKSEDENINKLFKLNFNNYYTSVDLSNAQTLGLKYNLIIDDKPNFLYWSRDKTITFYEVFENYVSILFPLKEGKVKKAKNILNILWGALCEVDKRKQYITTEFKINDDEEIVELYPSNKEELNHVIKTTKLNNYYKTNFARICPFVIAQGRRHMAQLLLPHKENVKRILTDGFLINKRIDVKPSNTLGNLMYEGYNENAEIINCINKIKLHF